MDYNTQDTRSFDSYVSTTPTTTLSSEVDYFTVLPLIATVRRTSQLAATFGLRRFVPWTALCLAPSFVVASLTALFHVPRKVTDPVQLLTMTPFDEIWQALPLVLWHLLVLAVGATAAQCVMVRFLAEFYGRRALYTSVRTSLWTTALRHGSLLLQAGLFSIGSLTVVYLVGHVMTVGLVDLRTNANKVHDKDPFLFGTIATASVIIMLVLDGFVVFAVIWLAVMYAAALPIILLEQTASSIDVFRVAYVLARDSRSYLALSWAMASLPGVLVSALIGLPWHAATRQPKQDFVEWQLGTQAGIWALYLPMLVWLPLLSIHQTVLYMTLRVVKDGLTLEILQGDLDRAAPSSYAMIGGNSDNNHAADRDTMPLALGPGGSHNFDDDDVPENELDAGNQNHDIELSERRKD